jgi:ATP-dependent Clp protease adaptor protein ClpS
VIVSSNENETDAGLGVITLEDEPQLKEPPLFQVVLLNDDFTPMEFVVYAIQKVFGYEHERATQIMLSVHTKGKGVCGIFPKEIAEMKCAEMNNLAQINEHPLLSEIEPITD